MANFRRGDCVEFKYASRKRKGRICHKDGSDYCVVFWMSGGWACKRRNPDEHDMHKVTCTDGFPDDSACDKCDGECQLIDQ